MSQCSWFFLQCVKDDIYIYIYIYQNTNQHRCVFHVMGVFSGPQAPREVCPASALIIWLYIQRSMFRRWRLLQRPRSDKALNSTRSCCIQAQRYIGIHGPSSISKMMTPHKTQRQTTDCMVGVLVMSMAPPAHCERLVATAKRCSHVCMCCSGGIHTFPGSQAVTVQTGGIQFTLVSRPQASTTDEMTRSCTSRTTQMDEFRHQLPAYTHPYGRM